MALDKYKIEDDELNIVTGGLDNPINCPYFLQADGKEYINKCSNCFYNHINDDNKNECSNSLVNNK